MEIFFFDCRQELHEPNRKNPKHQIKAASHPTTRMTVQVLAPSATPYRLSLVICCVLLSLIFDRVFQMADSARELALIAKLHKSLALPATLPDGQDQRLDVAAMKIQRKFRNFHTTRKLIDRYLKFNCPTRESARTFT